MRKMKDSTREKLSRLPAMTCRNCDHCESIHLKRDFKKTDDGGINWKYNYLWNIDCIKNGKFSEKIEGTANKCKVPSCSLWRRKQ